MSDINVLTAALLCVLFTPIFMGAFQQFSQERVRNSLRALLDNLFFLICLFAAIYMTRKIFFDHSTGIFRQLYSMIPDNIRVLLYGQDIFIYLVFSPLILLLLVSIFKLPAGWLHRTMIDPLADSLSTVLDSRSMILRPLAGALVQVPKAVFWFFTIGLLLNFYVYYFPSPGLSRLMNDSAVYQTLYQKGIYPALNSNIAKKIPVLVNDSFGRLADKTINGSGTNGYSSDGSNKGRIRIIEYFNGVTLDEAIRSNPQIDATARSLAGRESGSRRKAYVLYQWISQNIQYDYDKAARISSDPRGISSGSIVAFTTRKGICFDYSSLYISMCRAVGLKVRLITGLGYSGMAWGDHAWNQVYIPETGSWINVDATFGSNGDYFDKPDFNADHRYGEVQGEW